MTDAQLKQKLDSVCHGDITAFEEIYHDMKTPLFTVILRITQDRALSEDILQEVFLKLYQLPPKRLIKKPRAYLFQMARNLAIDSMRKQPQYADIEDVDTMVPLLMEDWTAKVDIENAMKTLTLMDNQIVSLHVNGSLKFREIAEITGLPLGTVLWKYQKAISKLRTLLGGSI